MPTAQKRVHSHQHKKRHGHHHKQGKHYVRVYWPYLPLVAIIIVGAVMHLFPNRWDVLAYATNLSHQGLLDSTNQERARSGSGSLTLNDQLNKAAQAKANDMAMRDYWSHNTPEGNEPWIFILDAGYEYKKAGENLAYGFTSNGATINGWMNSPSHRTNMLDTAYSEVGFGYANVANYQKKGEVTVVVAMYGTPASGTLNSQLQTSLPSSDSASKPVSTAEPITEQTEKPVTLAQTNTSALPWLPFAVGLFSGLALTILVIKHGFALRRLVLKGEAFFMHHPLIDALLLVVILVGLYMSRTAGFIV